MPHWRSHLSRDQQAFLPHQLPGIIQSMELTPRLRLMSWLVRQGLTGLPENDLLRGFCERCRAAGMAVVSVAKGLYHWAQVTGFVGGEEEAFENQSMAWQTATIYFAVIELVAAVGLWLATPWGAVVWLTTVVSMAVIELMFPGIYGGSLTVVGLEALMLAAYLALAWMSARERPP